MKKIGLVMLSVMLLVTFPKNVALAESNASTSSSSTQEKDQQAAETGPLKINLELEQDAINTHVGDDGQLDLGEFEGIKLRGEFTEIKDNPYIELKKDGKWKALKKGKTAIPVKVSLSEKTVQEIEEKYPNRELTYTDQKAKTLDVKVENEAADSISVNYSFSPARIETRVGSTGQLTVGNFEDIPLDGTFKEIKDNPYVELTSNGKWRALRAGKTTITPKFTLSEKTMTKIKTKYPGKNIVVSSAAQDISIAIEEPTTEPLILRYSFSPTVIEAEVGATGQVTMNDFEDISVTGAFTEVRDNPYIEVASDGTWRALAAGETEFVPQFTLSEETIAEIKARYPGRQIAVQETQQIISVRIKERSTVSTQSQTNTGTSTTAKSSDSTGTLPKTGESESAVLALIGVAMIIMFAKFKKQQD